MVSWGLPHVAPPPGGQGGGSLTNGEEPSRSAAPVLSWEAWPAKLPWGFGAWGLAGLAWAWLGLSLGWILVGFVLDLP